LGLSITLMFLVSLPPSNRSRHHDQQNKHGHDGKAGTVVRPVRVNGRMLLGDDASVFRLFVSSFHVLGNCLILVDPHTFGIGTNIGFVEDTAGQEIKLFVFEGTKQAGTDLGRGDDLVERDSA
jgi:hypothetical protein